MSANHTPSKKSRARDIKDAESAETGDPMDAVAPGGMDETPPMDPMDAVAPGGMDDFQPSEADRFPPANLPAGAAPPAAFEPGVVEVEFRDEVRPQVVATAAAGAAAAIASPAALDLSGLNEILQRYQLERAEPSIEISEPEAAAAQEFAQQQGVAVPNLGSFVTLHFPPDTDTQSVARELSQLPEVERAVAVPRALPPQTPLNEPLVGPNDQVVLNPTTGLENQWYIFRCRANQAWSLASGAGVVVADVDWGYRTSHQDLATRLDLSHAYNAFDGGTNVSTGGSVSHGTAVMGIAGGADNNLGIAGFAFGATLWPVQADSGPGPALGGNAWARGIDWVRTTNSGGRRKVIILEVQTGAFGNYEMVPSVNAAIRTAIANGVVVCVAAGNGNRDAGIDDSGNAIPVTGSILVGATEYHATENRRAGFSNFGPRIVVCAPGDGSHDLTCNVSSDSAYRNGFGGTSGATPKVAGTAALMLEANPSLTHEEIRTILRNTGTAVVTAADRPVGTFLNAEAAVRAVVPTWSGWEDLGGMCTDGVAAASWAANRLDCFVIGNNRHMWHKWYSGSWSGWEDLGRRALLATGGRLLGTEPHRCLRHRQEPGHVAQVVQRLLERVEDLGGCARPGSLSPPGRRTAWTASSLATIGICGTSGTTGQVVQRLLERVGGSRRRALLATGGRLLGTEPHRCLRHRQEPRHVAQVV